LYLQRLHLVNFRNYQDAAVDFGEGVQCLLGDNGSGKTNLLDAIHYLSLSRSSLTAADADNVRTGESYFSLRGNFSHGDKQTDVGISYQSGQKKSVFENGIEYQRLSMHLGKYPVVLIAPADIELVWDGSEIRRRFFDTLMSQVDRHFLESLIAYNAHLKMRNSMLRHFSEKGKVDPDLLEANDTRLVAAGTSVYESRAKFIAALAPVLEARYRSVSGASAESATIEYRSDLRESSFGDLLTRNLQRDLALLRTTSGTHRDDFIFRLNGFELKRYGSQGQQKSFLLGIKLAEFDVIAKAKQFKPILLLDDIFDKLDNARISRLIGMMRQQVFGQVFLTDARPDRTRELLSTAGIVANILSVENGVLVRDKA
jgi:DNA replication and repair protein RecF